MVAIGKKSRTPLAFGCRYLMWVVFFWLPRPDSLVNVGKIFMRGKSMKPPAGSANGISMAETTPGILNLRSWPIMFGGTERIRCAAMVSSDSFDLCRSARWSGWSAPE
jgi:hypothetical protein